MKAKKLSKKIKKNSKDIKNLKKENRRLLRLVESVSSCLCIKDEDESGESTHVETKEEKVD
jgi:hypothetical protein